MGRKPCCDKVGLNRGPWTIEEDHKLMNFILNNGIHCWRLVPKFAGLMRCGKSCRLRWINYLRPDLKRGTLSEMEENQIIELHSRLGNRWSKIAAHFPGRTDNEIKNHWNTRIKKRLKLLGLDPVTHKPIEQSKNCNKILESSSSRGEEESLEVGSLDNPGLKEFETQKKQDKFELASKETTNLLHSYNMCERKDVGLLMNPKTNPSNTCSSFSLENSLSLSMVECSSLQEDPLQHWLDTVDSILSWDSFHHLEENFSLENH
ncbi:hypothetical protein HHK36_015741 [Tetracentron sinense]|uniref:Uncharacterized protein n=1 Tax=Tetracentron sinense TaxID=13715 RepID=A0A835DE65_TETSI|nr:hypothetical protein HHK36_015716 [Tetracentron sinense]KAF8399871.1 hypothetical protein HHK36_015741 [Tetracentron sinense]